MVGYGKEVGVYHTCTLVEIFQIIKIYYFRTVVILVKTVVS